MGWLEEIWITIWAYFDVEDEYRRKWDMYLLCIPVNHLCIPYDHMYQMSSSCVSPYTSIYTSMYTYAWNTYVIEKLFSCDFWFQSTSDLPLNLHIASSMSYRWIPTYPLKTIFSSQGNFSWLSMVKWLN